MSKQDIIPIGIIGCGNIAPAYIAGCKPYKHVKVVACADLDKERTQTFAKEHGLRAYSIKELLADPDIRIVINLTIPAAHAKVNTQILNAGKSAYTEKPFCLSREEGRAVLALAKRKGLLVGCAPDTFLGGGSQTVRSLIDSGAIGKPLSSFSCRVSKGPEGWHPRPEFFYQRGGGPLFDMGPYDITGLINFFGQAKAVTGSAVRFQKERMTRFKDKPNRKLKVDVPVHHTAIIEFASGPIATTMFSWDVWKHNLPDFEIHGEEGSLVVPDLNMFGGDVLLYEKGKKDWKKVKLTHSAKVARGIGVADMAKVLLGSRSSFRANGAQAYHVYDIMQSVLDSSKAGKRLAVKSTCERPKPLPRGLRPGQLD